MSIYDDLALFKLGLVDRVKRELPKLHPVAQTAAHVDVTFIETQMAGYYERLDLWYQRVWKLQGLWLDPDGRVLRHKGKQAVLTNREFELLQFLLDHPHRYYTSSQIMGYAWSDSALFPEEVRNYVSRLRKIRLDWRFRVIWSTAPVAGIRSHFAMLASHRGTFSTLGRNTCLYLEWKCYVTATGISRCSCRSASGGFTPPRDSESLAPRSGSSPSRNPALGIRIAPHRES